MFFVSSEERVLIKHEIKNSLDVYLSNIQQSINNNTNCFWSYVRVKSRISRKSGGMIQEDNNYSDPLSMDLKVDSKRRTSGSN